MIEKIDDYTVKVPLPIQHDELTLDQIKRMLSDIDSEIAEKQTTRKRYQDAYDAAIELGVKSKESDQLSEASQPIAVDQPKD